MDFKTKEAYCKYLEYDDRIPIDFFKSKTSKENYNVWEKFWANNNHELHKLTSKKINSFLDDFTKLDLFKKEMPYNSDSSNEDKFQDIDKISRVDVKIYYENEDMEEFRLINRFPEKWMEFGNLLMGLVGFDVLNIENLRYLISELHFDIKKEGVYLNGKKLSLTKLYYYRGGIYGSLCYNYSIDFVNKKINRPLYNHLDFPDEETVVNLTDDECFFILNLIEKTGVYRWYHQDYLNRMKSDEFPHWMFDGTHWYFDLIFDDEYVMHLGGHEEYPDTYRYFASEIKELLNHDWFEVNRIEEKYVDDYKFWESKLID